MLVLRGLIGGFFQLALFGALLLLPAGTWDFPRALLFLAVYGVVLQTTIVALVRWAPASLEARLMAPAHESQPFADRIVTALLLSSLLVCVVFVPLDVFRFQLLPAPSPALSIFGAGQIAAGYGLIAVAIFQNAFAAPIVKDQTDRGQELVDSGVYARIRHPFYTGLILWFVGLALWLESTAGAIGMLLPTVLVVARIHVEERTLRNELPGYEAYTRRVRYRLVPFVW